MSTLFIQHQIKEDIESYRIRKIKWAIDEMIEKEINITPYKLQLYAGFGGVNKVDIRNKILYELNKPI